MYAQTVKSTEMRFRPRSRLATTKRTGFALEFGLKIAAAVLGALGLVCAMVCTYLYQSSGYMIPSSPGFYYTLKIIETATTVLLLVVIVLKYRAFLHSELREHRLRSLTWKGAGSVWVKLFVELVICAVCCPIGVSWTWYVNQTYIDNGDGPRGVPQSIDGIVTCVMMLRLYLFIPLLPEVTGWHSAAARAAGHYSRVKVNDWLAMRAILITHPIVSIVTLWVVSVGCFAWALQATEYGVCTATPAMAANCAGALSKINLNDYATSVWCILITMLTVGYGDVSALTTPGKTVSVVAAFSGAVLNGMLVATLTGALALQPAEQRARQAFHYLVHKAWATREIEWAAGKLILEALWDHTQRKVYSRGRRAGHTSTRNALMAARAGGGAALSPASQRRIMQRSFDTLPQRLRRAIKHFRGARLVYRASVEEGDEMRNADSAQRELEDSRDHFEQLSAMMRALADDVGEVRAALGLAARGERGAGAAAAPTARRSSVATAGAIRAVLASASPRAAPSPRGERGGAANNSAPRGPPRQQ